jgi:hypothetical protein
VVQRLLSTSSSLVVVEVALSLAVAVVLVVIARTTHLLDLSHYLKNRVVVRRLSRLLAQQSARLIQLQSVPVVRVVQAHLLKALMVQILFFQRLLLLVVVEEGAVLLQMIQDAREDRVAVAVLIQVEQFRAAPELQAKVTLVELDSLHPPNEAVAAGVVQVH